jgi:hypothetical protein
MMTKYEMVEKLKDGIVTVVFEKVDGSTRTMKGTLLGEYLPQKEYDPNKPERAVSDESVSVWDIEKNGWRSFRVDSVKEFLCE